MRKVASRCAGGAGDRRASPRRRGGGDPTGSRSPVRRFSALRPERRRAQCQPGLLRLGGRRPYLCGHDRLGDRRRRILAQGDRRSVRLHLRLSGRRHRRRHQIGEPLGGRYDGGLLHQFQGRIKRRTGPADLQFDRPGRRGQLAGRRLRARPSPTRPTTCFIRPSAAGSLPRRATSGGLPGTGTRRSISNRPIRSAWSWSNGAWPGTPRAATRTSSTSSTPSTTSPPPARRITSACAPPCARFCWKRLGNSRTEEQCGVRYHAARDGLSDHRHARGVRSGHGYRSVR